MTECIKIAVIFTCFNRKENTIRCINSLIKQRATSNFEIIFYICDDNSTDGTVEAIKKIIPEARIEISNGNLFWCRGMYHAMDSARREKHDYYLMINDDVDFYDNMIQIMIDSYQSVGKVCGIVGTMLSLDGKEATYGGRIYLNKHKIGKNELVIPSGKPILCDIANWNCFMVPQEVIDVVGVVDPNYEHGLGDFDYSLMMRKKEYSIYIAKDYVGRVNRNDVKGTYLDKTLSRVKRLKRLVSIKGRPIKSEYYFYVKHYGVFGIAYFMYVYLKLLVTIMLKR